MKKTIGIIILMLALAAACGDVSVTSVSESSAVSDSVSSADADSVSSSDADSDSSGIIEKGECARCAHDEQANGLAEEMYAAVLSLLLRGGQAVDVSVVNDIYLSSLARLDAGFDVDAVQSDFYEFLDGYEESVTT